MKIKTIIHVDGSLFMVLTEDGRLFSLLDKWRATSHLPEFDATWTEIPIPD